MIGSECVNLKVIDGSKENVDPLEKYWSDDKLKEEIATESHMSKIKNSGIYVADNLMKLIENTFRQGYYAGSVNEKENIMNLYQSDKESFDILAYVIELDKPRPKEIK